MEHLTDLETWAIVGAASWKLFTLWWPLVVVGVGALIWEAK